MNALVRLGTVSVLLYSLLIATAPAEDGNTLTAEQAADHVGETATVCGEVASTAFAATGSGQPTFLHLERTYPGHSFAVVIWGDVRYELEKPPEALYDGKTICVEGEIKRSRGTPQIEVNDPGQITVQ